MWPVFTSFLWELETAGHLGATSPLPSPDMDTESVGTGVQVLVAVVLALEVVLAPVFKS